MISKTLNTLETIIQVGMNIIFNLYVGKFYNATCVDTEAKQSIYLLEASNLPIALNIINEAFLYNGTKHRNIFKFQGAYMNEIQFSTEFFDGGDRDEEEERDEKSQKEQNSTKLGLGGGVSY